MLFSVPLKSVILAVVFVTAAASSWQRDLRYAEL